MTNPETARIVDRLISCRDNIPSIALADHGDWPTLREMGEAMADAANALSAYDKTMAVIAGATDA